MLFIKELKKICFSFIYVLFIGLLLFSWHENFYGVTTKEITGSQGNEVSISSGLTGGSILEKPEKNKESYGMKNKEVPDKIMCGGTDKLIMEYLANSYATYPFSYYKEVVLNENEQKEILNIIKEITGLNEQQINHLTVYLDFLAADLLEHIFHIMCQMLHSLKAHGTCHTL